MKTRSSLPTLVLAAGLLLVISGPAVAADAASAPSPTAAEPAVESVEISPESIDLSHTFEQYGDCSLWCDGEQYWYYNVTREQCCNGSLSCPDGSTALGYAFYPYEGYAEFCSE